MSTDMRLVAASEETAGSEESEPVAMGLLWSGSWWPLLFAASAGCLLCDWLARRHGGEIDHQVSRATVRGLQPLLWQGPFCLCGKLPQILYHDDYTGFSCQLPIRIWRFGINVYVRIRPTFLDGHTYQQYLTENFFYCIVEGKP